mgnify:CR=1 FL=1
MAAPCSQEPTIGDTTIEPLLKQLSPGDPGSGHSLLRFTPPALFILFNDRSIYFCTDYFMWIRFGFRKQLGQLG